MGQVGDGSVVAPFANEAMRLLREDWQGKYGSKMLAEELFPILQTGIPQPDQNFQNFITINAGDTGSFAQLIDKYGNKIFEITSAGGLTPIEPPGYPPPKLRPRIVWSEKTINAGVSIDASELDAVAVDPETGAEIDGVYVYDPPDGTTFASAGTATLYVNFTPTDGVKYRRAMGSTVLTILGSGSKTIPDLNWSTPADIWLGTALSGTQLNCTATDPITFAPVAGSFVYTPPSGTVLDRGEQFLEVEFTPTDTVTYDTNSQGVNLVVRAVYFITNITAGGPYTVLAGDLIIIGVEVTDSGSGATVAVTDSGGNTYTQAGSYVRVDDGVLDFPSWSLWYAFASAPATLTVTVTPSGGVSPSASIKASGQFRGAAAIDGTSSGSGTGGESFTAGTCPVNADSELVVMFPSDSAFTAPVVTKSQWSATGVFRLSNNVSTAASNSTGTPPLDGADIAVDPVASGTAPGSTLWAIIAASFTHRTS